MKYLVLLAVIVGCALGQSATDRLFVKYGGNQTTCLTEENFEEAWLHFDSDNDGSVTKLEFDTTWSRENFPEKDQAPGDFVEIDINRDLVLTSSDFQYLFKVFDENADGEVCLTEWRQNFRGIFNIG